VVRGRAYAYRGDEVASSSAPSQFRRACANALPGGRAGESEIAAPMETRNPDVRRDENELFLIVSIKHNDVLLKCRAENLEKG
jgi:hypothetical protein